MLLMLTIRLSRHGRTKKPFFRVVLTEHTKSVKSWFKDVLGRFDPLNHKMEVDVDAVAGWVAKWATLSERFAKLLYNETKNEAFKKFVVIRERTKKPKKEEVSA